MKYFGLLALIIFSLNVSYGQKKPDGLYVGVDPDKVINDKIAVPKGQVRPEKFTRVIYLKIKGKNVYMDIRYADIVNTDTTFYKSDGVYDYFDGTYIQMNPQIRFDLKELIVNVLDQKLEKDENGVLVPVRREVKFNGQLTDDGIQIDKMFLKKIIGNIKLVSEDPSSAKKIGFFKKSKPKE